MPAAVRVPPPVLPEQVPGRPPRWLPAHEAALGWPNRVTVLRTVAAVALGLAALVQHSGALLAGGYAAALESGDWPSEDVLPAAERLQRGRPLDPPVLLWR